jgi:signal transduction histidine kinase
LKQKYDALVKLQRTKLATKLGRVFALQVALVSLAVGSGIFITNTIVDDFLISEALEDEADHYWALYQKNQKQSLPNTNNMTGYMADASDPSSVPQKLRAYPPGFLGQVDLGEAKQTLYVSQQKLGEGPKLYLLFASDEVSQLALLFGILPLSIALILIYGFSFLTYRLSHQAISPLVQLADYLEEFRFGDSHQPAADLGDLRRIANPEVDVMIDAIDSFAERLDTFIERERIFTRDASHELRTPIAVFKGSLDLLQLDSQRSSADLRALDRMRRTVEDMEGLIGTMLLLARGEEVEPRCKPTLINELVPNLIEQLSPQAQAKQISLSIESQTDVWVYAPERVVQILIMNLLRNAINYTDKGGVTIAIGDGVFSVKDTGIGMSADELHQAFEPFYRSERARMNNVGHGLGLAIVSRMVEQFNGDIDVQSQQGVGTEITITLPELRAAQG